MITTKEEKQKLDYKNMFDEDFTLEKAKEFMKKLKSNRNDIIKKNVRKEVFLTHKVKPEYISIFFKEQKKHYDQERTKEIKRARNFLFDKKEADKAGWNYTGNKKSIINENIKKQKEWSDKATPNIKYDLWELDFDIQILISYMKSF